MSRRFIVMLSPSLPAILGSQSALPENLSAGQPIKDVSSTPYRRICFDSWLCATVVLLPTNGILPSLFHPMFTEPTGLMFLNEHFRLVTFTYTMGTLYQFFMRHFSAGDRFDAVLRRPDHFQQVLISSPACALIRFCITILISMPIGHWVCTIFGVWQVSVGYCFSFADALVQGSYGVWNLTFLLPRSACIISNVARMNIHEDSFLKGTVPYNLRSRSRFSGGSFFRCGTRSFLQLSP